MAKNSWQKYDDDRTGFTHQKYKLVRQRGLLLAPDEVDDLRKIVDVNPRWGPPRENSTTTTAVNTPTIFSIVAGTGIDPLQQSFEYAQDGDHEEFFMHVAGSGGAVDITADPQIVAGSQGQRVTLKGTDDTNTVTLDDGTGLQLILGLSAVLQNGDTITLVYDEDTTTWYETSRFKGGV